MQTTPYSASSEADLFTVSEVAQRLRVDVTTVRRWIKAGALQAVALPHMGKRQAYRIHRTDLERLLTLPSEESEI